MGRIQEMMTEILSISENTPYKCVITSSSDKEQQRSNGDVIFYVKDNALEFDFFPKQTEYIAPYKLFGVSNGKDATTTLNIPSQDFQYPIHIRSLPHSGTMVSGKPSDRPRMKGLVTAEHFGSNTASISSVTMWFNDIPNFIGTEQLFYKGGIVKSPDESPFGGRVIGCLGLNAGGWLVKLNEVPAEMKTSEQESHVCVVKREGNHPFTPKEFCRFLEDLIPFLSFAFGKDIHSSSAIGRGKNSYLKWGIVRPQRKSIPADMGNWYLRSSHRIDIAPLFREFYGWSNDIKKHWRKVIRAYVASEEIANMLSQYEIAESVSFSALEGLTKSIISTYIDVKDQWLNDELKLKQGKGIKKAIELVAKCEIGSTYLNDTIDKIATLRNDTMHLDLKAEGNPKNAFFRWNNSQSLIEAILLAKLGLTSVPNRTQPGTFEVMGKDMFWESRAEATKFYEQ